jgi:hypothetical protein
MPPHPTPAEAVAMTINVEATIHVYDEFSE